MTAALAHVRAILDRAGQLPPELLAAPRWLLWRSETGEGPKPRKVPYYANGARRNGTTDTPEDVGQLVTFDRAAAALESGRYTGPGIALGPVDPGDKLSPCWQGIDLDKLSEHPDLVTLGEKMPGYIERSPSGDGLHAIGLGARFATLGSNKSGIEAYSYGRYFTVTGIAVRGQIADLAPFVLGTLAVVHGPARTQIYTGPAGESFFAKVNAKALQSLDSWAPVLFPQAREYHGGYRVSSAALGRALEEDISIVPTGIRDFGEERGLTPLDLVVEWGPASDAKGAALWLCELLHCSPATLGWNEKPAARARLSVVPRREDPPPPTDDDAPAELLGAPRNGSGPHAKLAADVKKTPEPSEEREVKDFPLNDIGNGQRLIYWHGQDLRYSHEWHRWLVWDGRRWAQDKTAEIHRRAKDTQRRVYSEIALHGGADEDSEKLRQKIAKHAAGTAASRTLDAMLKMAASEPGIPILPAEMDADPWVLNVRNGTVDLRTGELRPHNRADLLTKLAAVDYDATALCPVWEGFLWRIMGGMADGDKAGRLIGFLQRAAGYSLTADVTEQVLFFLHGGGANGKSTFIKALMKLMGDYAQAAPPGLLLEKKVESHPTDLAGLFGARFVSAVEPNEGKRLDESLVKLLTGGDERTARRMREDNWSYMPTDKIWLAANHKPPVRGTDRGIWRRIKMVPFEVEIPVEEWDLELSNKLAGETSGILRWALAGCLAWQQGGLQAPPEVEAATKEYRGDMDVIAAFLADRCVTGVTTARVAAPDLYSSYTAWCQEQGERPATQRKFSQRLQENSEFDRQRSTGGTYYWLGLGLADRKDEGRE